MVNDLSSELVLYKSVDDCTVSKVVKVRELDASKLPQEIQNVTLWARASKIKVKVKKNA